MQKTFLILGLVLLSGLANADIYSDADAIMNEKENIFMNYFPSHQPTQIADPWIFRYYPETNNYQGINQEDGNVYAMGSDFSETPILIASIDDNKSQLADEWGLRIVTESGEPLPMKERSDGSQNPQLAVGTKYRLQGHLPKILLEQSAGDYVVIETKPADSDTWQVHKKFKSNSLGFFDHPFVVTKKMQLHNHFQARIFPEDGELPESTFDSSLTSETLTTTTDYIVNIQLINDTKHDLIFNVPLGGTISGQVDTNISPISNTVSGQLDTVPVQVNVNQTVTLTYTNPGLGTSFGWVVNRTDCFAKCDNFVVNWAHTPNKNYTACVDQMPKLNSGQTHYVRVTPRTLSASMDLFIWGDYDPLCSAGLDNGWGNFWDNHPALTRFAEVTAGAAAVALVVLTFPEEVIVEDAVMFGPGTPEGIEGFIEAQLTMQGEDAQSIEFAKSMFRDWVKPFF